MSGCTNASQALSRSLKLRAPRHAQTLPFLYQTATLRRYYSEDQAPSRNDRSDGPLIRRVADASHAERRSSQFARGLLSARGTPSTRERPYAREPPYSRGPQSESRYKKPETDEDFLPFEAAESNLDDGRTVRVSNFQKPETDEDFLPFEAAESNVDDKRTARVSKSRKPETNEDFVPFETPEGAEPVVPEKPSTMTETERKTFEKLEALASKKKIFRFQQEDNFFESLDDVLNEALVNMHSAGYKGPEKKRPAKETRSAGVSKSVPTTTTKIPQREEKETHRILNLIRSSKTDMQVWEILETELFTPIASLNLDQAPSTTTPSTPKLSTAQRRALMNEFPKHLTAVAFVLRVDYPGSNLILSLIPRIRSLGPSVYALGASAKLYNQVIAFLFEKYTDIDSINELLGEMEREVIEPNEVTLRLLDYMDAFKQRVQKGGHGTAIKSFWGTEKFKRSFDVLGRWRSRAERLLTEQEVRFARKNMVSNDAELGESEDAPLIRRV